MMDRRIGITLAMATIAIGVGWVLFVGLPRWTSPSPSIVLPAASATAPAEPKRHIRARLYHVAPDGARLQSVDSEVELGDGPRDQARHLVEALLTAPPPLASAIPAGTHLRSVYLTSQGVAFVDLSAEVSSKHPGGVLEELLTVYSVVDTLTDNLPAITSVQVLVDGHETDTLAGHVDLRLPLAKNLQWAEPAPPPTPAAGP